LDFNKDDQSFVTNPVATSRRRQS